MRLQTLGLFAVFLWGIGTTVHAEEVKEKFPDGKVKLKYRTDRDGNKNGRYLEYYAGGKIKIKANYNAGKLQGKYLENYPDGKVHIKTEYENDLLHGLYLEKDPAGKFLHEETYIEGILTHPKSMRQITETLAVIHNGGIVTKNKKKRKRHKRKRKKHKRRKKKGKNEKVPAEITDGVSAPVNIAALRRLNQYRYLCDVPWDVTLNAKYCDYEKAAAELCKVLGRIEHYPKNPGMPEAAFKKGYFGTSHANLAMTFTTPVSVDRYMEDSDPKNIQSLGHRRWCINPKMLQTGFGAAGMFSAMYSVDQKRTNVPDYDFVAFPPRGYLPVEYFKANYAWSISFHKDKYQMLDQAQIKVAIYPLKEPKKRKKLSLKKRYPALTLNYLKVSPGGMGIKNCLIFRPDDLEVRVGARYWVEIRGVKDSAGKEVLITYLVEFS